MARSLEELQKQYNSAAAGKTGPGMGRGRGPGGGPGRGMGPGGKPKNLKHSLGRLFGYLAPYKGLVAVVLAASLTSTLLSLCGSYMLAPIIDRLSLALDPKAQIQMSFMEIQADRLVQAVLGLFGGTSGSVMGYVLTAALLLAFIYLISALFSYLSSRLGVSVSARTVEKIRNELFSKLQTLPVRYFDSHPTGEIMSRFTNDIDNIDSMLSNSLMSLISGLVSLLGTLVFMFTTNTLLSLVTIIFVPVFTFGGLAIAGRSRKYYGAQQAALGAVNGYVEELVTGQKVVKVFNRENECVREFETLNEDMRNKQFMAQFWGGVMGPLMGNTSQVSYAVTVGLGGLLMVAGRLTPGGLTVFASYAKQFSAPITQLSSQMSTVFAALAGAERVFEVMDSRPEEADALGADPMPDMKGHVVFQDVSFGYLPGKPVLKHISLYARPGQKIAFVGSTGAGKTTVTNLLNRFYDTDEGLITIDGVDIRKIERSRLRRNIAMVLQDTHLFTGTVRDNIRYGRPEATDEEVEQAARTASAHSFIRHLEQGYDTMIEGDGANLSQGQRQLLNIARAALSKAPILVLDEATSSVDTRTERHIEKGMDRLMKDRTTFVIAHRLSTVRNANAIMVLEQGEIIERGDHEELLAMKGRYYELYTGLKELD